MKKTITRIISLVAVVIMCVTAFNVKSFAYSEHPDYFDLGNCLISVDAGSSKDVWFRANYNYVYFMGNHTSKQTYCQCTGRAGSEYIKIHIGPDETVKNVFFYFYVKDDKVPDREIYETMEVYVQKINPAIANPNPAVEQLKSYANNNAAFNAYYYYVNYPDLQAAFGTNGDALLQHYTTHGVSEKRVANKFK